MGLFDDVLTEDERRRIYGTKSKDDDKKKSGLFSDVLSDDYVVKAREEKEKPGFFGKVKDAIFGSKDNQPSEEEQQKIKEDREYKLQRIKEGRVFAFKQEDSFDPQIREDARRARADQQDTVIYSSLKGEVSGNFTAGMGDVITGAGQAFRWRGYDGMADRLIKKGGEYQVFAPEIPEEDQEALADLGWEDLSNPRLYTQFARQVPFTLSAMVMSFGGVVVASAAGLTGLGGLILGAIGGTALSTTFEASTEAGRTYDEALEMEDTPQEAKKKADKVFKGNAAILSSSNLFQTLLAFAKIPKVGRLVSGTTKLTVGAVTEAGEEVAQGEVARRVLDQPFSMAQVKTEAFYGALGGLFFTSGGMIVNSAGRNQTPQVTKLGLEIAESTNKEIQDRISQEVPGVNEAIEKRVEKGQTRAEAEKEVYKNLGGETKTKIESIIKETINTKIEQEAAMREFMIKEKEETITPTTPDQIDTLELISERVKAEKVQETAPPPTVKGVESKKGMPGEVSTDGLHTRGTDGKWHLTKKESGNSFKVDSLNEKTGAPDGTSYVIEIQTSRSGKVSVARSIIDGDGKAQFIDSIPIEKAQAKYQTTDPNTLANRMVNPFKDYNYQTERYSPVTPKPPTVKGVDPLIQDPNNFKSAEEFVKANNKNLSFVDAPTNARGAKSDVVLNVGDRQWGSDNDAIVLSWFETNKKATGRGTQIIEQLKSYADAKNKPLYITNVSNDGFWKSFPFLTQETGGGFKYDPRKGIQPFERIKGNSSDIRSNLQKTIGTEIDYNGQKATVTSANVSDSGTPYVLIKTEDGKIKTLTKSQLTDIWNKSTQASKVETPTAKPGELSEPVQNAAIEVLGELEVAQPGQRIFTEAETGQRDVSGVSSTFPQWVSPDLRRTELFERVRKPLDDFLSDGKVPQDLSKRERDLFNEILDQIESRAGETIPIDRPKPNLEGTTTSELPVESAGKRKNSKAYTRVIDQLTRESELDVSYNELNLKKSAEIAVDFVVDSPQKAIRVALGQGSIPTGTTQRAIQHAVFDQAIEQGNFHLASQVEAVGSLQQTRRGQEIVTDRGRINDNSVQSLMREVLNRRLDAYGQGKFRRSVKSILKKGSNKKVAMEKIKEKAQGVKNETIVKTEKQKVELAQSFLNDLIC